MTCTRWFEPEADADGRADNLGTAPGTFLTPRTHVVANRPRRLAGDRKGPGMMHPAVSRGRCNTCWLGG